MKRICAWCKEPMGEIAPEQPGVTHGICESCKAKILAAPNGQFPDGGGICTSFDRSPSISNTKEKFNMEEKEDGRDIQI